MQYPYRIRRPGTLLGCFHVGLRHIRYFSRALAAYGTWQDGTACVEDAVAGLGNGRSLLSPEFADREAWAEAAQHLGPAADTVGRFIASGMLCYSIHR